MNLDGIRTFFLYGGNNAVNKLDGYYNKGVVIKKLGRLSGYFTAKGMIILRIDGKYSLNVFVKYFMRIKRVTDVSLCKMFLIALMPKKLAFYYINLNYKKLILKDFASQRKNAIILWEKKLCNIVHYY